MSEHITHTPTIKRLERSSSDKIVAGVCGGLGRYFDLNPAVFRLGLVVLTILGGAGILVYLAAVLVMPAEGQEQSIAAEVLAQRRDRPWPLVGLGLVGVALAVMLARADTWPIAGAGWFIILVVGLAILWTSRNERRGHRILIAVGSIFAVLAIALATAVITAFAWFDVSLGDGVGDHAYRPATAADVRDSYRLGIGTLRVDLSQVAPTQSLHVSASVGMGELRVIVPRYAAVVVNAGAKAGDVNALGTHDEGRDASVQTGTHGVLVIDAHVGAGRVDVERGG